MKFCNSPSGLELQENVIYASTPGSTIKLLCCDRTLPARASSAIGIDTVRSRGAGPWLKANMGSSKRNHRKKEEEGAQIATEGMRVSHNTKMYVIAMKPANMEHPNIHVEVRRYIARRL